MRIVKLTEESRKDLLSNLLKRSPNQYGQYEETVRQIIERVKNEGDDAILDLAHRFDHNEITKETLRVTEAEIDEAVATVGSELYSVMEKSAANIRAFHEKQKRTTFIETRADGTILGQRITPIEKVGVYVPGGKAAYPSSTLMTVIPAKVAGVDRIIMTSPAGPDGKVDAGTLAAARIAGVDEIYKTGGAQAIAALAFGTEQITKVDKIVGPGNMFVALAKKEVFGYVSIDSIAGPSEILVLADNTADPKFVAADLLSQAEHDQLASAILITTDAQLADKVNEEIDKFLEVLPRREIIEKSLENYGYILLADDLESAIDAANAVASEHLEILMAEPFEVMTKIRNAGAIFMGPYSSEPLGDYFAGPNHVLPTNGTARFFSPLGVDDFIKKTSLISYSKQALYDAKDYIQLFANSEGLSAHANSIKVRFED